DEGFADTEPPPGAPSIAPKAPLWTRAVRVGAVAVIAGALGVYAGRWLRPSPRPAMVRFPIPLGVEQTFTGLGRGPIAISPDGRHLAYVADRKLFRRSLSELESRVIVNVDTRSGAATSPVFSPD